MKKVLFLVLLFYKISEVWATHIMGGELTYRYIDKKGGGNTPFRYAVMFDVYINCENGSCCPNGIDQIDYSIYDVKNNSFQGRVIWGDINNVSSKFVTECNGVAVACIRSQKFVDTISVAPSPNGYHLYFEHCCRNEEIVNLNQFGSMAFHAYIPATIYANSSPQFNDIATPFMCVGDTNILYNAATDPDGDKLIFSLEEPLATFIPPNGLGNVGYLGGFEKNHPFGVNNYSYIDASTGNAMLQSQNLGNYVVGVNVKEFRNINGQPTLLSETRRDLQILVRKCSNHPPEITNTEYYFEIAGGDQLCFDITGKDVDNDSVSLSVDGNILKANSGYIGPLATFKSKKGYKNVKSEFCWDTDCSTFGEFQFIATVKDNSCKEVSESKKFKIKVKKQDEKEILFYKNKIVGDSLLICKPNVDPLTTILADDSKYEWQVNHSPQLDFKEAIPIEKDGIYYLSMQLNNCRYEDSVFVITEEIVENGPNDTLLCRPDSIKLFGDKASDMFYQWRRIDDATVLSSADSIAIFPLASTKYELHMKRKTCEKRDTVLVKVTKEPHLVILTERINDNLPQEIKFGIEDGRYKFNWDFGNGSHSNLPNPSMVFANEGNYWVKLTVTDENNCAFVDSTLIPVLKFLIPNVITPNDDGLNDDFKIANFGEQWSVSIFNRWGCLVYRNESYFRGWYGDNVEAGVYYYDIYDKFYKKSYKGWVEVLK